MYNISASPHVRDNASTRKIMQDVILALIPAALYGVYRFGLYSLCIMVTCMVFSMLVEGLYQYLTNRNITITDGSAALTGLLIAMNVPVSVPLWIPLVGCAFAILMVKQIFGGLGQNFMNPALAARCFLLISFTKYMTAFTLDGVSTATPLAVLKETGAILPGIANAAFIGNVGGVIGEVCAPALILGGLYLIIKKVILPKIPLTYIGSFLIFVILFGGHLTSSDLLDYIMVQLFGGGLMLGAIFMATDYVTSPITPKGRTIYGIIIGVLTGLFRVYGASAEGVSYAIIIGNMLSPLIEKYTKTKAFGVLKEKKEKVKSGKEVKTTSEKYKTPSKIKINALVVLTCITLVAGVALGYIYQLTKDTISEHAKADTERAYKSVCQKADTFTQIEFTEKLDKEYGNIVINSVYSANSSSGEKCGIVVNLISRDGYGGDINLVVGIDNNCIVEGVQILSISETAGLGMNAESVLVPQYPGKNGRLKVTKDGGNIDAISGATITSRAVTNAVSVALYIAEVSK